MQKIIDKLIQKECEIFGFDASNITTKSRALNEFDIITVHFDMSTSKKLHRYMLLCLRGNEIIYKTSNCIDKDYFFTIESCLTVVKNYFKSMNAKFNKLNFEKCTACNIYPAIENEKHCVSCKGVLQHNPLIKKS